MIVLKEYQLPAYRDRLLPVVKSCCYLFIRNFGRHPTDDEMQMIADAAAFFCANPPPASAH